MIKRRKTSCESHAAPADVQDSKAVSAPNAPKPANHFGQTSGVQEIQKGLHCPHMTKCRICSAYYLNCWGHQLKHKDEIPMFLISFTESILKARILRQVFLITGEEYSPKSFSK